MDQSNESETSAIEVQQENENTADTPEHNRVTETGQDLDSNPTKFRKLTAALSGTGQRVKGLAVRANLSLRKLFIRD